MEKTIYIVTPTVNKFIIIILLYLLRIFYAKSADSTGFIIPFLSLTVFFSSKPTVFIRVQRLQDALLRAHISR